MTASFKPSTPRTSVKSSLGSSLPVMTSYTVRNAASITPPVAPKISPAPLPRPNGVSNGVSSNSLKLIPAALIIFASSTTVKDISTS